MRVEAFTVEQLIRMVDRATGEQFMIEGEGKQMRLRLHDEVGPKGSFSAKGRTEIIRYLQGMIRASMVIAARGK